MKTIKNTTFYVLATDKYFVNTERYGCPSLGSKPAKFFKEEDKELLEKTVSDMREQFTRDADRLEAEIPVLEKQVASANVRIAKYKDALKDKDNLPFKEVTSLQRNLRKAESDRFTASRVKMYNQDINRYRELSKVQIVKATFAIP
jgi:predicted  nucleic acid-binding Zn-ribbon protein